MRHALVIPMLFITTVANAQSPAERIAPYLTDGSIAVARADVQAIDIEVLLQRFDPYLPVKTPESDAAVRQAIRGAVASIKSSGAKDVFVVVDLEDIPDRGFFIVVPLSDGTDANAIRGLLRRTLDQDELIEEIDGALVAGTQAAIERVKENRNPVKRTGLEEAFTAAADRPVQVVLVPSPDHRRVLREMLPDLPAEYGGATGEQLAAGVKWASLGVALEPKLAATLVVQSESEQAAEAMKAAMTQGLRTLSTKPEVLKTVPILPMLVGSLTPKRKGDRLVLVADETIESVGKAFAAVTAAARAEAGRNQSVNNLKQLGLAMHNFYDTYGSLPPSASYDENGKPLLSWRVYMLPFLGEMPLYQQFRLDEPWDSEHNRKLIERMPAVFQSPDVETPAGQTVYLAPTGDGLIFDGKAGTPFREITDGTSNTILVVEATAEKAVPWTKPADLAVDPQNPLAGLTEGREIIPFLCGDGAVHRRESVKGDLTTWYHLMTRAGGEVIDWEKLRSQ